MDTERKDVLKLYNFWREEINKAGLTNKLPGFTDVLTGIKPPGGYGEPVITDATLDGKLVDIYHTNAHGGAGDRIFIHIKTQKAPSSEAVPFYGPKEQVDVRLKLALSKNLWFL